MEDKTTYGQSLMHMIKGNLGTGILAMPASFAHAGLINASIVNSSCHLEGKTKGSSFEYAGLARCSFQFGPTCLRGSSQLIGRLVDAILLVAQIGVCCVYLVFVTDNIVSPTPNCVKILSTYRIYVSKNSVFLAIFPIALCLSYIRTLNRLAIASAAANLLQAVGISIILQFLARDLDQVDLSQRVNFQPFSSVALGFGSAMFAFEGISVVLPVYSRMRNPQRMSGCSGIINVSYAILLILNFAMGLLGFLKFGREARDSITLNLPAEPLYDIVRAIFLLSVFLTYPLQFYVPNEIVWNWARKNLLPEPTVDLALVRAVEVMTLPSYVSVRADGKQQVKPAAQVTTDKQVLDISALPAPPVGDTKEFQSANGRSAAMKIKQQSLMDLEGDQRDKKLVRYEYLCRTALVMLTFVLAITVPKLNLLMDLIGSITGTTLSLILPAIIHLVVFWDHSKGVNKFMNVLVDLFIIVFGFVAGTCGTVSSLISIMNSFNH